MREFEFTLKYKLPDADSDPEIYVGQLLESGCDDALIGIGQRGRIALQFNWESESALEAVFSAMKNIKNAIPGAEFIEATPDFVGVSDIAEIIGCSRQNILKMVSSHIDTFPMPVHSGRTSFWHLSKVLAWFEERQHNLDPTLIDVAFANMQVNIARELAMSDPDVQSDAMALTA